jgi:hypothetical protein
MTNLSRVFGKHAILYMQFICCLFDCDYFARATSVAKAYCYARVSLKRGQLRCECLRLSNNEVRIHSRNYEVGIMQ